MTIQNKKTVKHILKMKQDSEPITMVTAYDYSFASIIDAAGIDIILVGDSASNVFSGNDTTIPISLNEMIYHAKAVMKGTQKAMVVVDMPFGTYQISVENALENAIQIFKETGVQGLKLEGGKEIAGTIKKIVDAGIPVMGHLGLTPQSIHQLGSFEVQAKSIVAQDLLLENSKELESAGCFSIVLEKVPASIAKKISSELSIPIIGIGAGNGCDGQVLVMHDLLGLNPNFNPKFVRKYADLNAIVSAAIKNYVQDVKSRDFPNESESY
jgi:3-methyl-2-oxobutanoate hydroxymethyltransferase